jgi:hypothetical protein
LVNGKFKFSVVMFYKTTAENISLHKSISNWCIEWRFQCYKFWFTIAVPALFSGVKAKCRNFICVQAVCRKSDYLKHHKQCNENCIKELSNSKLHCYWIWVYYWWWNPWICTISWSATTDGVVIDSKYIWRYWNCFSSLQLRKNSNSWSWSLDELTSHLGWCYLWKWFGYWPPTPAIQLTTRFLLTHYRYLFRYPVWPTMNYMDYAWGMYIFSTVKNLN